MTGSARVIRANALALPLDDASVDLCVTSPPYFGLRSYQDGGEHYEGQIGDEATPAEFVDALLAATREMVRVVKPSGSIWVNLGDKYSSTAPPTSAQSFHVGTGRDTADGSQFRGNEHRRLRSGVPTKSLIGVPWRYALRCIDDLGLILRAEVIWSKPNGLPESVTDRVRRSHETWFHLVKQPRYFSAVDEVREEHTWGRQINPEWSEARRNRIEGIENASTPGGRFSSLNPLGKLPGSVWTINEGESLVRSVLAAVSEGAITVDEAEGILRWTLNSDSWHTLLSESTAGSGPGGATSAATARPQSQAAARSGRTESPIGCSSDPSPMASPSTTSVATPPASTPTTSRLSLDARTSAELTPSETPAATGTASATPTSSGPPQALSTSGAGRAIFDGSTNGESVWLVPTQPLRVPAELGIDHFAAFPMELVRRIIRGWSPSGICVECGEGRRPVSESRITGDRGGRQFNPASGNVGVLGKEREYTITGYACACPEPTADTTPAVVLDPFGGTGTTALVAKALGRDGISVDMSADYCRLAEWRTNDPGELARAMQVEKPPAQVPDQLDMFGGDAA